MRGNQDIDSRGQVRYRGPCDALQTLICFCFSYFDWLGGGAYFDGMEDLEAGKFKKNDKFKIPNEKLHDQGGSTLKSP